MLVNTHRVEIATIGVPVQARQVLLHVDRRHHRPDRGEIGAHVGEVAHAHREEIARLVERQLALDDRAAPLLVGQEAVRALVAPFDRAAERPRRVQDRDVFGIGRRLHAERAADVVGEHPQPLGLDLEQVLGERAAQAEHALAADVQGEAPALGVVVGDGGARLHGRDHHPIADQPHPGDVGGRGERLLRGLVVAEAPVEAEVGVVVVQARRGGADRRFRVGHGGQPLDVHLDQVDGIARRMRVLGDHHRERLADVAYPVLRRGSAAAARTAGCRRRS